MEDSYILGIKKNGVSLKIDTLSFESDQSGYEYICNVDRILENCGNGKYDITVSNHDFIRGCPIGNGWVLLGGYITYNWNKAFAYLILSDKNGDKTNQILASSQITPAYKDFNIDIMAKSIVRKAQEIVLQFPSASVYNAYVDFIDKKPKYHLGIIDRENTSGTVQGFISGNCKIILDYINQYKQLSNLLSNSKDPKCEQLLMDVDNVMIEFIKEHFK